MYLKKVEVRGFKSFGDLVELDIPQGITAVVGPNGCGKSNIADAMRWVLGEQSAKLLRCSTMQDVIFAGTEDRSGLGYAQVSMTIDNSDQQLAIDYSEVVVTRRLYRSGESEYLINQSPCRLKDVHELFMGTGVGKEGYSIIGQGQIDKILSTKPEDRRNLFEEAAGIYKYKLRKLEAEKKLEKKQENLVRIQDILSEVEKRLVTLEKQAAKAKEYMNIREILKEIELNIFIDEADKLEEEISKQNKAQESFNNDYRQNEKALEDIKLTYSDIREKLLKFQESSSNIQNEIMTLKMDTEQQQSKIKINKEKIKSIDETVGRLNDENKRRNAKSIKQKEERDLFKSKELDIKKEVQLEIEQLNKLEDEFKLVLDKITSMDGNIESHKTSIYDARSRVSNMEVSIENGDTLAEQINNRRSQINNRYSKLASDREHLLASYKVVEKHQVENNSKYKNLLDDIGRKEENIETLRSKKEQVNSLHRSREDLYHKSSSRYNALLQMKNEYEGFYRSVKNILNLKAKDPAKWENIYGVVGELISVPENLELAINTALGNSVQHIVTKDEETASQVIEYIKRHKLGRATFLPLSSVKGYPLGADAQAIVKEAGVVGFANTLIDYDKLYSGIMENLLGRVIVIDNMDNAIRLAKKYRYRYRIVTLEGEVLNPGGSITGGSFYKDRANIFSRNREVKELKNKIDQYELDLGKILEEGNKLDKSLYILLEDLSSLEKEKSNTEKSLMELKVEEENKRRQLEQYKDDMASLEEEKKNLSKEEENMNKDIYNFKDLISRTNNEIKDMEKAIYDLQEKLEVLIEERETMASEITDHKVSISSKNEILKATREQIARIEEELKNNNMEDSSYDNELENNKKRKERYLKEIDEFKLEIEKSQSILKDKSENLDLLNDKIKNYNLREEEKRQEQDNVSKQLSLLQNEIYKVENRIDKLMLKKENSYSKVWEKYEATYQDALAYKKDMGPIDELRKSAREYKDQIKGLGIINTSAIEEFDETKERYEFMKKHEEDILEAEETLLKLIDNLTSSMEVIFKEEFEKISHNFNIVFTELFGGGEAFLELTDTDDVLESGIEIIARPPGKKLQNMMLLSGGERALTAIAILFGILRLKPSPFAVLDEIEAALDDANVARFSNYLKKMGEEMQFLIITHRKGTMAVADTIYGVTMEEKGVSKIVSIQLDEVEEEEE